MSADKYPSIFSRQMETIVYLYHTLRIWYDFFEAFYFFKVHFSLVLGRF